MKDAAKEANVRLLRLHHAIWEGLDDPLGVAAAVDDDNRLRDQNGWGSEGVRWAARCKKIMRTAVGWSWQPRWC